jgi:AraC-like DNA-binding protein
MIRVFKQYEGVSPKRFRRQIGGEAEETVKNVGRAD